MKIDVYSTMRNEEVLLPYWLRHYEQFADRIFVWEDQSTDRTREILAAHPKVKLMPIDVHGIDDQAWVEKIWGQYATMSRHADWAMPVDADEFVYHPKLVELLAECTRDGAPVLMTEGWLMVADGLPTTTGQIYHEFSRGIRGNLWQDKPCVVSPKVPVVYAAGRHFLRDKHIEPVKGTGVKLLHYRYLGKAYCLDRSARNMERMSQANLKRRWHKGNLPDRAWHFGSTGWYEANAESAVEVDLG